MKEPSEEMIIELVNSIKPRAILTELEVEMANEIMSFCRRIKKVKKIIRESHKMGEDSNSPMFKRDLEIIDILDGKE